MTTNTRKLVCGIVLIALAMAVAAANKPSVADSSPPPDISSGVKCLKPDGTPESCASRTGETDAEYTARLNREAFAKQKAEAAAPTQKKFPATNSEKGCLILGMAMLTRIEQINEYNEESCRKMKTRITQLEPCIMATGTAYNRTHGHFDLDRIPTDISDDIIKGCLMLIYDSSEEFTEHAMKQVRRK
jgi:hypothetical protein